MSIPQFQICLDSIQIGNKKSYFFSVNSKWNSILRAESFCALRTACDSRTSSGHGAEGNKTDLHD